MAITQSHNPPNRSRLGQRYARHARRLKTSLPTIASAKRTSAKNRKPAAKSQWAISARGSISPLGPLEVVDQSRRDDEGEEKADQRTRSGGCTSQSHASLPSG